MNKDIAIGMELCNRIDKKYKVKFVCKNSCLVVFVDDKQIFLINDGKMYTEVRDEIKDLVKDNKLGYPYRCSRLYYEVDVNNIEKFRFLIERLLIVTQRSYSTQVFKRTYNLDKRRSY